MNSTIKNQLDALLSLAAARGQLHALRDGIKETEMRETRRELLASFCDEIMQKINVADDAITSLLKTGGAR